MNAGLARIPVGPLSVLIPPQPAERPIFLKMDVEGGECRALRGLRDFLRTPHNIIGALIETGQPATQACCKELTAPNGAFDLLYTRYKLCPRVWPSLFLHFETLCSLATHFHTARSGERRSAWPWELTFLPCSMGNKSSPMP